MTYEHRDSPVVPTLDDIKDEPDLAETTVGMGTAHVSTPPANVTRGSRMEEGLSPELFSPEQLLVLGTAIVGLNNLSADKARSMGVALSPEGLSSILAAGRALLAKRPELEGRLPTAQGPLHHSMTYFIKHRPDFKTSYADSSPLRRQIMEMLLGMNTMQLTQLQKTAGAGNLPLRRRPGA